MIGLLGTYPYQTLTALFLGCIVFRQFVGKHKNNNLKGLPLPPGPKGYPLIRNLFDFPIVNPWLVYQTWCNTYGEHFKTNWPFESQILVAEEAVKGIHEAGVLGAFWVDVFPVLKHVPSWFPSAGFQKKAACWREVNKSLIKKPFCYVEEELVRDHLSERLRTGSNNGSATRRMAVLRLPWPPH